METRPKKSINVTKNETCYICDKQSVMAYDFLVLDEMNLHKDTARSSVLTLYKE